MTRPADVPDEIWRMALDAVLDVFVANGNEKAASVICRVARAAVQADRAARPVTRIGGLTAHQKQVFDYLAWFIAKNGIAPSYGEIQVHLGLASKSSVQRVIVELEERGAISRLPNRSRAITIIANPAN